MNEVYGRRAANKQPALKRRRGICKRILMVVVVAMLAIVLKPSNPAPKTLTNSVQPGRTVASMPVSTQDTQPVTEKPVESVEVATPPPVETPPAPVVAERPVATPQVPTTKTEIMRQAGIPESDYSYVDYIVSKESSWNPEAYNASSGSCSLVQALPCSKIPGDWKDPVNALKWQYSYVLSRYGSYAKAHAFWVQNHWY